MFELVKKIAGVRRLFSTVVAAATLATVTSIGGVAGAAGTPTFYAPPSAPIYVTATASAGSVIVDWSAPYYSGGVLLGYNVYMGTTASGESTTPVNGQVLISGTSVTVPGLTNGTKYYFTVSAVNVVGTGPSSSEVSATPLGVPGAPTGVTLVAANGSVTVSWTAPTSNGGSPITGYNVYCSASASPCTAAFTNTSNPVNGVALVTGTSYTVTGLVNGLSYNFVVAADNAVGEGPASAAATTAAVPASGPGTAEWPYWNNYTSSSVQVCVQKPQSDSNTGSTPNSIATGGSPIIGYDYYVGTAPGGESATPWNGASTPVASTCDWITGLNPGTVYYFKVAAVTAKGVGPQSFEIQRETNTTAPGTPTGLKATVVNNNGASSIVTWSWTAPTSTGGRAIEGYDYTWGSIASGTCVPGAGANSGSFFTSNTYVTLTSQDNTLLHCMVVDAYNAAGVSALTAVVTTPIGDVVPSAPTLNRVESTTGTTANVTWSASAYQGNGALLGYNIYMGSTPGGESPTALNGNTPWPSSGTQIVTNLIAGQTYYFTVKAINAVGLSAASNEISVTAGGGAPGAPTNVAISAQDVLSGSNVLMSSWTAAPNGGDTITNYQVCTSTTSGGETLIGGNCYLLGNTTSNSFNPSGPYSPGQTVYVQVRAENSDSGFGPLSTEVSYVVPDAPNAPTNLTSTVYGASYTTSGSPYSGPYSGYVKLSWTASTSTGLSAAQWYEVYDTTDNCVIGLTQGTSFLVTGWQYNQNGIDPGYGYINPLTYCGSGNVLNVGSTTTFQVWAVNSVNWSVTGSNAAAVTSGAIPDRPHDGSFGVSMASATSALVSWTSGVSSGRTGGSPILSYTATAYIGNTVGGTCTYTVGGVNAFSNGCLITGLPTGTYFTVSLVATNAFGSSYLDMDGFDYLGGTYATGTGAPVLTMTSVDTTHVYGCLTDVSAFRNNPVNNFQLFWSTNTTVSSGSYTGVYGGSWTYVGSSTWCTSNITVAAATAYTFGGYTTWPTSPESNIVSITAANQPPAATTIDDVWNGDPTWNVAGNNGTPNLNAPGICFDSVAGATGYNIYIGTSAGGEAATPVNGILPIPYDCYNLYFLSPGTTYYIIVKALNGAGLSPASNEVTITPPVVPSVPLNVVGSTGDHSVTLNWDAPTSLGTSPFLGYYIYAGQSPNGENSYPVNHVAIQGTSYTVTGLTNGSPYYFMVVAANAAGISPAAFGEEVSVTPEAQAATSTRLTVSSHTAQIGHENRVVLRVSVTGAQATGTVTVKWTNRTVCTMTLVRGGSGSCLMGKNSINKTGTRTMKATYVGDANSLGSVGKATIKITK